MTLFNLIDTHRRAHLLLCVLFGVFMLTYTSVLLGDRLVAWVCLLTEGKVLFDPWLLGGMLTLFCLPLLWAISGKWVKWREGKSVYVSLLQLFLLFFVIGISTNSNEQELLELRTARLCAIGQFEAALQVGENYQRPSSRMLSLRAFALQHRTHIGEHNGLAESLFDYPLSPNMSAANLRLDSTARCIAPFYSHFQAQTLQLSDSARKEHELHHHLIGMLLDRKLQLFVRQLTKSYGVHITPEQLPTIYREALYLYSRLTTQPVFVLTDPNTAANYQDFQEALTRWKQEYPTSLVAQRNQVSISYGNTYWFYYYYYPLCHTL